MKLIHQNLGDNYSNQLLLKRNILFMYETFSASISENIYINITSNIFFIYSQVWKYNNYYNTKIIKMLQSNKPFKSSNKRII